MRSGYFVGVKKSINHLHPHKQKQIRDAYRDTGFAHNDSEEGICFCLGEGAEERANQIASDLTKDGIVGFCYRLPVNECLPEETADLDGSRFPASGVEIIPLAARVVDLNDPVNCSAAAIEASRRGTERIRQSLRGPIFNIANENDDDL